jgi:hypothetical protein
MFGAAPRHQPADIHVQGVGDLHQKHARRCVSAAAGDDAGDRPLRLADLELHVVERNVSGAAENLNAFGYVPTETDRHLVSGIALGVAGVIAHWPDGGHLTTATLAEHASRGSKRHF